MDHGPWPMAHGPWSMAKPWRAGSLMVMIPSEFLEIVLALLVPVAVLVISQAVQEEDGLGKMT